MCSIRNALAQYSYHAVCSSCMCSIRLSSAECAHCTRSVLLSRGRHVLHALNALINCGMHVSHALNTPIKRGMRALQTLNTLKKSSSLSPWEDFYPEKLDKKLAAIRSQTFSCPRFLRDFPIFVFDFSVFLSFEFPSFLANILRSI